MERAIRRLLVAMVLGLGMGMGMAGAAELTAADYIEIQQLYARYNAAIDRGDAEGWADTFTADGVFAGSYRGREALKGFVTNWRNSPQMNGAARRHFAADLVITPDEEGARGSVSAILVDLSTMPMSIAGFVSYADVLVKTPQGWRFKSREVQPQSAPAVLTPASR